MVVIKGQSVTAKISEVYERGKKKKKKKIIYENIQISKHKTKFAELDLNQS